MKAHRHRSRRDDAPRRPPAPKRKVTPTRLRTLLYELTLDWVYLHGTLAVPTSGGGIRSSNVREYGHPAEWASDQCRQIVDVLWAWHDEVAERRGETRPKPIVDVTRGNRGRREQRVLADAWRYLEVRLDDMLAERVPLPDMLLPAPWLWEWTYEDEAFDELFALRRTIKFRTCEARPKYVLTMPCPNSDCGMKALERVFGMKDRPDFIVCGACGHQIPERNYPFLVRTLLDTLTSEEVAEVG